MKLKKFLVAFGMVAALSCMALGFVACDDNPGPDDNPPPITECDHKGYFSQWVDVDATCRTDGSRTRTCSNCGYQEVRTLPRLDHDMLKRYGKAATCTEDGYTDYEECSYKCGTIQGYEVIPAFGHDMKDFDAIEPTCVESGYTAWQECQNKGCGLSDKEEHWVPALGHDYDETTDICKRCNEERYEPSTGLELRINSAGDAYVAGIGTCQDEDIVIPETYENRNVREIGSSAFSGNKALRSVKSRTVSKIGDSAFAYSTIESIEMDKLTQIDSQAFARCNNLTEFTIPKFVTQFGTAIFDSCDNLKKLEAAPDSPYFRSENNCIISKAENSIVLACSISEIPTSVTAIGRNAFTRVSIEKIVIPDNVKTIESWAFFLCDRLVEIEIGSGIESIAGKAFENCTSLEKVTIADLGMPTEELTKQIGAEAFLNCRSLKEINYLGTKESFKALVSKADKGIMGNELDGQLNETNTPKPVTVKCYDGDLVQGEAANEFVDA